MVKDGWEMGGCYKEDMSIINASEGDENKMNQVYLSIIPTVNQPFPRIFYRLESTIWCRYRWSRRVWR